MVTADVTSQAIPLKIVTHFALFRLDLILALLSRIVCKRFFQLIAMGTQLMPLAIKVSFVNLSRNL